MKIHLKRDSAFLGDFNDLDPGGRAGRGREEFIASSFAGSFARDTACQKLENRNGKSTVHRATIGKTLKYLGMHK